MKFIEVFALAVTNHYDADFSRRKSPLFNDKTLLRPLLLITLQKSSQQLAGGKSEEVRVNK